MSFEEINFMRITPVPKDPDKIINYIQATVGQVERIYLLRDGVPVYNIKEGKVRLKDGIMITYYGNPDTSPNLISKIQEFFPGSHVNIYRGEIRLPD